MSVIEGQRNYSENFTVVERHSRGAELRGEGAFARLPTNLVGIIAEFLPQTYGALPAVNKKWRIGVNSVKCRIFTKKDKENLDLIAVFKVLSYHYSETIPRYLLEHPITDAQLQDKGEVQRIAGEIRTWISANPDYSQGREFFDLNLSQLKLHTLPLIDSLQCDQIDLSHNRFTDISFIKQLPPNVQVVKFDSNPFKRSLTVTLFCQKILLVLSTAAAILSVIPPIRSIGSLVLRSLSCLSSTLVAKNSVEHDDRLTATLKCIKIATAVLGLIGLILAQPHLIVIALGVDIAFQLIECIRGAVQQNVSKSLIHLGFTLLNALVLASLVLGLWQIIVAAAALSALLMLIITVYSGVNRCPLECICSLILMGISITSAITSAEMRYTDNYHYEYKNTTDNEVRLFDRNGHEWFVNPGETIQLDLTKSRIYEQLPFGITFRMINPVSFHETIEQQAISFTDFPTVPVGSPFIENTFIPFKPWVR